MLDQCRRTSANLIQLAVTNVAQQLVGENPNRVGIIFPVPDGVNSYQVSFAKGFPSSYAFALAPYGFNEVWWAKDFGQLVQLPIWVKGNGSFTVEFTEITCDPEE